MQCTAFQKPKIRAEPTRREMVIHKLNLCKTDMNPVLDLAWCLLRLLHRGVLPVPNGGGGLILLPIRSLMPNQPTWPPCTQLCEDEGHVCSTRTAPCCSNNGSATICHCSASEVGSSGVNLVGTSYVWEVSIRCHASLHV